jgi:hypothetical protein
MSQRRTFFMTLGAAVWALLECGCGGPPKPDYSSLDLCDAHGRVTLDGDPLSGALVLFEAQDLSFSYALTDDSGRFQLMYNSEKTGVSKGPKTVRIWSSRGIPGLDEAGELGEETWKNRPERVPARYNVDSELTVSVGESSHEFDFQLES